MALFVKQPDKRSDLQDRIAADLRGKLHEQSQPGASPQPDSEMLRDKKQSSPAGLVLGIVAVVVIIIAAVVIIISAM